MANIFFNIYLQELSPLWTGKTFPDCINRDVLWCLQRLQGSVPVRALRHCHVPTLDSPRLHVRAGTGERVRKLTLPQECSSACWRGFCPQFQHLSQCEPPLHGSVSSGQGTFPQFICKHRNSHQFLFWTDQRKQQLIFLKLAHRPHRPFIFPNLSCRCN